MEASAFEKLLQPGGPYNELFTTHNLVKEGDIFSTPSINIIPEMKGGK